MSKSRQVKDKWQKRPCGKLCSRCQGTPTILTLTKAVLLSVFDNCDRHGGGHDTSCHPLDFQIFHLSSWDLRAVWYDVSADRVDGHWSFGWTAAGHSELITRWETIAAPGQHCSQVWRKTGRPKRTNRPERRKVGWISLSCQTLRLYRVWLSLIICVSWFKDSVPLHLPRGRKGKESSV